MFRPFQTPSSAKRTYRELRLLIVLNHPDAQVGINILSDTSNIVCIFRI
jgi:hypothetical protein